jgi:hypothetical protein
MTLKNALKTLENALKTLKNALRTLENGHKLKDAEGTLDPWDTRGTQGGQRSIGRRRDGNGTETVTGQKRYLHCINMGIMPPHLNFRPNHLKKK